MNELREEIKNKERGEWKTENYEREKCLGRGRVGEERGK